jgi:hypothetical protein
VATITGNITGPQVTSGVAESVNSSMIGTGAAGAPLGVNGSSVPIFNAGGYPAASGAAITSLTPGNMSAGALAAGVTIPQAGVNLSTVTTAFNAMTLAYQTNISTQATATATAYQTNISTQANATAVAYQGNISTQATADQSAWQTNISTALKSGSISPTFSSGTFTATGSAQYSLTTSSGINVSAGIINTPELCFGANGCQTAPSVGNQSVVTQNPVALSRAFNTVFHNTTGKVMFVAVTVEGGANYAAATAYTDSNAAPSTTVAMFAYSGTNNIIVLGFGELFFIVLPGNYYEVINNQGMSLINWIEWN